MGIIFPPYLYSKRKLYGEERVFRLLKNIDFPKDYFIFHSLNIPDHIYKKEGEADFLILSSLGILIIEVKGAKKIVVNNGVWKYFTDSKDYESNESPFNQAKTNYYSILNRIEHQFPELRNLNKISGYGVIFPNMVFNIRSFEWCDDQILDENNLDKIESYIEKLYKYWQDKSQGNLIKLSSATILKLKDFFRPDFEKVESIKSFISSTSEIVDKVTQEQYSVLDGLSEYSRIIVKGLAGTGKTFLAIEQARRKASAGEKVLFLCFNKLLMQNLYSQIQNFKNIDIYNIDKLIHTIIKNNNVDMNFPNIQEMRSFLNNNIDSFIEQEYDYLIIDEAQDILSNEFISLFSKLLKGGVNDGSWAFFLDDYVQDELYAKKDEMNSIIRELKDISIAYNLSINCRNAKFIGDKIKVYTSLPIPKIFKYEGGNNNLQIIYTSKDSFLTQFASTILQLQEEDIYPNLITILSPNKSFEFLSKVYPLLKNTIETFIDLSNYSTDIKKERLYTIRKNCLSYATIQAYKGLENEIIILCNIDSLETLYDRAALYTGMSRAKSKLIIFIDESFKTIIN